MGELNMRGLEMHSRRLLKILSIVGLIILLAGCGSPETKKMKFYEKGKSLFEKGDYVRARLELKNAIQIDPRFADAYCMLGTIEMQKGNLQNAYDMFTKTVDIAPGNLKAQQQLGTIYLAARQPEKAMEKAELVLKADPKNEDGLLLKGATLLVEKKIDAAISHLETLKKQGMKNPQLFLLASQAYLQKNEPGQAEGVLKDGIGLNPKSIALNLRLARLYAGEKRFDDAVPIFQRIIGLEPDQASHRLALAELYWESGKADRATEVLNALTAQMKGEERWAQVATFYVRKGRIDNAEQELKKGIEENKKSYPLRLALSDFYLAEGRTDQALAVLKECLTLSRDPADPGVLQAKNRLARIHFAREEVDEAERYVQEIISENSKDVEAHFQKGLIHMQRGEPNDAVAEFRGVLNEDSSSVPAHLRLAEALVSAGEMKLAAEDLQKALKENPSSLELQRAIGRIHGVQGEFQWTEEYFRKLKAAHPQDLGVMGDLADLFLLSGDLKKAEAEYGEIKRKAPQASLGYERLGSLYLREGKVSQAAQELEEGLRIFPQSAEIYGLLVEARVRLGRQDLTLALADERLKKDPEDAFDWNLKGSTLGLQKNYPKAEEALRKAIGLRPLWPRPRTNLAGFLSAQKKWDEAVKVLEDGVNANPEGITALRSLGQVYCLKGDFAKAMETYEKVLKLRPNLWAASNDLAFVLAERAKSTRDLDRALVLGQKAMGLQPKETQVLDTVGWVHYKRGEAGQAVDLIGKAQAQAPTDAMINFHMGMALVKAGKPEAGKKFLSKALENGESFYGREEAQAAMKRL